MALLDVNLSKFYVFYCCYRLAWYCMWFMFSSTVIRDRHSRLNLLEIQTRTRNISSWNNDLFISNTIFLQVEGDGNCYDFFGKIWNRLTHKVRKPIQICYLTHSWGEKGWTHAFRNDINVNANVTDSLRIWIGIVDRTDDIFLSLKEW